MDCDMTKKKGEKIDYTICINGKPSILVECKHWQENLDNHKPQLDRYFNSCLSAKFGLLTNGYEYRFYTDIVSPNVMDDAPFLTLKLDKISDRQIEELKKFTKELYNEENILSSAEDLKYLNEIKDLIRIETANPSDDFAKFFGKRIYNGTMTQKVTEQFKEIVKRAFASVISETMLERFSKMHEESKEEVSAAESIPEKEDEDVIETTEIELGGYYTIRNIVRDVIEAERVQYKDFQTCFSILIDGSQKKKLCTLYFNNEKNLRIEFRNEEGKWTKYQIESIDGINQYKADLKREAAKLL